MFVRCVDMGLAIVSLPSAMRRVPNECGDAHCKAGGKNTVMKPAESRRDLQVGLIRAPLEHQARSPHVNMGCWSRDSPVNYINQLIHVGF